MEQAMDLANVDWPGTYWRGDGRLRGTLMGDSEYVSTGAAARLPGVTPDTVLKWIKRGRLEARRTAGGHYRVSKAALRWLRGEGEEKSSAGAADAAPRPPLYCWEYHASGGVVRPECEQCNAYQAKALRCYELRCLPSGLGSPSDFCTTVCEACGYYRQHVHGPVRVLVVSDSVSLRDELQRGSQHRPVRFEFAAREYECAAIVDGFRPELVLIDCTLPRSVWTSLVSCMADDPRAAGLRIVLAQRRTRRGSSGGAQAGPPVHAIVGLPLDWDELDHVLGLPYHPAATHDDEQASAAR
jgi:excisionase family DNA binding protein